MSYDIHVFSWGMGSCEISGKNQTLLVRNTMDRVFERNRSNPRKKKSCRNSKTGFRSLWLKVSAHSDEQERHSWSESFDDLRARKLSRDQWLQYAYYSIGFSTRKRTRRKTPFRFSRTQTKGSCCLNISIHTSGTAQGGGGTFKNRKPIGEVGCESGMAERSHWLTDRCLICLVLSLSLFCCLSLTINLPTYRSIYVSIDLSICLSIYLSNLFFLIYLIYLIYLI